MTRGHSLFLCIGLCLYVCVGCASVPLESSLGHFYRGDLESADHELAAIPEGPDAVLHLMERGLIRQLRGNYDGSASDLQRAIQIEESLETHSLSKAGASMVVNDSVLAFRGLPYERTYLHVFQARNFLARGLWEAAAVEARNIIRLQERLDGFPDDPYSRYVAGLCLTLAGDHEPAAVQYRLVSLLDPQIQLDTATGRFLSPLSVSNTVGPAAPSHELICLVDMDSAWGADAAAEIYARGQFLGSARVLTHIGNLHELHEAKLAGRRMAKTVARIALKEAIAGAIAAHNKDLGDTVRFLLFAMETPDTRTWKTLPRLLAVARVPCPADLTSFDVVFRSYRGTRRITVTNPIVRKDRAIVSFCREVP